MKKIVSQTVPVKEIDIQTVLNNRKGFVVQIYENKASILCETGNRHGYFELSNYPSCFNTTSETREKAIRRAIEESDACELYYFETLKDFAEEVIKNGWECY